MGYSSTPLVKKKKQTKKKPCLDTLETEKRTLPVLSLPQGNTARSWISGWSPLWWRKGRTVSVWLSQLCRTLLEKPPVSRSTHSTEVGPPWLRGERRSGKKHIILKGIKGTQLGWLCSVLQQEVHPKVFGRTPHERPPTGFTGILNTNICPHSADDSLCVFLSALRASSRKWSALRKPEQGLWARQKPWIWAVALPSRKQKSGFQPDWWAVKTSENVKA